MTSHDPRSQEAVEYRRLYKTPRWKQFRAAYLAENPLCVRCLITEEVTEATVVHHAKGAHKGDEKRFWEGPFEGLCKRHHDSDGQLEDHGKTVVYIGVDGYPIE